MHSYDLEACEMKCCCFGSIWKSNFWHVNLAYLQKCSLYSGERSVPLGALVTVIITPANKVWGVYRNHPVCLSVCLSACLSVCSSCPGHNFLTPCPIGILFHTIFVQGCVMTLSLGHISKVKVTVHTYQKSVSEP